MQRHIPEIEQLRGLEAGTESVKESTGNVAGKTGERELFSLCCALIWEILLFGDVQFSIRTFRTECISVTFFKFLLFN